MLDRGHHEAAIASLVEAKMSRHARQGMTLPPEVIGPFDVKIDDLIRIEPGRAGPSTFSGNC